MQELPPPHTHALSQGLLFRNPWTADSGENPGEGGPVLERVSGFLELLWC